LFTVKKNHKQEWHMCGRYTIFTEAKALEDRFHAYVPPGLLAPSYNAAPAQGFPTILHANPYVITVSAWGFRPEWADWRDVTPVINARAETVATKPYFRQAFRTKRCLVLADGFYEWQKTGKVKQPYCFEINDGELFAFAGIWDRWNDASGKPLETCSILTTNPNAVTSSVHDRMPVILNPDSYDLWLDPGMKDVSAVSELLRPYDARLMRCYPVSSRINSAVNDDEECSRRVEPAVVQHHLFS